ncbi:membrane hypothetical protein [Vibrio chagasii]|nr:membrane hypothetical protein [Vibrio chagasii]CAH6909130.1 membrane hypothetical protein [Vibrio chagasii]
MKTIIVMLISVSSTLVVYFSLHLIPFPTEDMDLLADIATVVMVLIQILALIVIKSQLKLQEHINVANYSLQATKELREHVELFQKIKESEDPDITNAEIMSALNVYENMSSLIEKGAISFKDIDSAFAFRFFQITDHPKVQQIELLPDAEFYSAIYRLHRKWLIYRESKEKKTDHAESLTKYEVYWKYSCEEPVNDKQNADVSSHKKIVDWLTESINWKITWAVLLVVLWFSLQVYIVPEFVTILKIENTLEVMLLIEHIFPFTELSIGLVVIAMVGLLIVLLSKIKTSNHAHSLQGVPDESVATMHDASSPVARADIDNSPASP